MGKKFLRGVNVLFLLLIIISLFSSCANEMNIFEGNNNKQINFFVSVPQWKNTDSLATTKTSRAMPVGGTSLSTSNTFNLIADQNDGAGNYSTLISSQAVSYTNNIWKTSNDYYWSGTANKTISFYAYYPSTISNISHTAGSSPTLSYTVPDNVSDQIDIMTATNNNVNGNTNSSTPLTFNHIFAAIQFSVGSAGIGSGTISSISIGNVANSGTYTFGGGWSNVTGSKTFTISQSKTITGTSGEDIYSGDYTLMMLPQDVNNITITVTYSNGGALTKTISGKWEAGKVYKYNLSYQPRDFAYTGTVQTYTAPVTGTYKLEVWGAEGSVKGGYSSGTITLSAGKTVYIYVGGKNSDGSYLNGDGATDIRLNGLIYYTPPLAYQGTVNARYYGPYWRNSIGTYQVDATGSGFDKCSFVAYNDSPSHSFTVTNVTKTAYHFTAYINVDIDVSSASYSGIELIVAWDGTKYNVTVSNTVISKLSDRIIIGAGYNSSNSTSGVTNGSSQVYANSGNGKAKITLLSVP